LDGLGEVRHGQVFSGFEIRNGPDYFENAVVSTPATE
jgi:hypothetical protein